MKNLEQLSGVGGSGRQFNRELPRRECLTITPKAFPLPHRTDTFARPLSDKDGKELEKLQAFAIEQADVANDAVIVLRELSKRKDAIPASYWEEMYEWLTEWRYNLAVRNGAHQFGQDLPLDLEDIVCPIPENLPNLDNFGDIKWLRADAQWNEQEQKWEAGESTPASRIMEQMGRIAQARFINEGNTSDSLQNMVELPDGGKVEGNLLVRGEAAERLVRERVAVKGRDAEKTYLNGPDSVFTASGKVTATEKIFTAAMDELAKYKPGEMSYETWVNVAYLLYQSPRKMRGSDGVIRTFLVAAGTHLLGYAPTIPQDIDLRAFIGGQDAFKEYMLSQRDRSVDSTLASIC